MTTVKREREFEEEKPCKIQRLSINNLIQKEEEEQEKSTTFFNIFMNPEKQV